jgi:hypothetical protein
MSRSAAIVALVACLAAGVRSAGADTIYASYSPYIPGSGAWTGALDAIGVVKNAAGETLHTDRQIASQFVVGSAATVTSYTLILDIFNYTYGLNGLVSLWSGTSEPTTLVEGAIPFVVSTVYPSPATIGSVARPMLEPGITYWLMVQAANGEVDHFSWGVSPTVTGQRLTRDRGEAWHWAGTQSAFQIEGTIAPVPEPATLLLFCTGVVVLVREVRHRR